MWKQDFEMRCRLVGDFWVYNEHKKRYRGLFDRNLLGFPLAYAIATKVIPATPEATELVEKAWIQLLDSLPGGDSFYL
jgi:hypothetical protein